MIDEIKRFSKDKNTVLFVVGLTISALVVRLYGVITAHIITPDGVSYIENARLIASGNFSKISESSFFNLFPFIIVLFQKAFHDWETAGRFVSVVFGSLAVIPFFLLIRLLINSRIAAMASLFYIISPRLVEYSTDVLREPVFWCFSIFSLYFAWRGIAYRKLFLLMLSALFVVLASFTRLDGVALILVILLWIVWHYFDGKIQLKGMFAMIFVFIISFPLIASPFLFALKSNIGKWEFGLIGEKLPRLILTHDVEQDLELKQEVINITPYRFRTFYDMAERHKYEIYFLEAIYKFAKSLHLVFFILFLFGVIKRKHIPFNKGEIPILIWMLVFFLSIYVYMVKTCYLSTRHGLLISIPALLWASIGFFELKEKILRVADKKTKGIKVISRYTSLILFVLILSIVLPNTLSPSGKDKIELKRAGMYLKGLGYSTAIFAGEHSLYRVAFYAGAEFITIPAMSDYRTFEQFIRENKADFIMVDERTVNASMPGLIERLDRRKFKKVFLPQFEQFKEYSIAIYKIQDS